MMVYTGLLLIIAILKTINCARILLVFPHVSVSHHIIGASLAAGLSESGHEVTLLSPNIHVELYNLEFNGSPPYNWVKFETFCDPIEKIAVANQLQYTSLSDYRVNYVPNLEYMVERGSFLSNMTLFDPSTRRLMRTGHFDLIIVEILYTEALLGLGQYFNAPVIAFSVLGMNKQVNDLVGNPAQPSYVPLAFNHRAVGLGSLNTILKRAYNLAMSIYEIFYINHVHHRLQRAHYWRAFPWSNVCYDEMLLRVSLVLSNSHFTTSETRPVVPAMVEVGGLHLGQNLPIMDEELQLFLDDAKDGFIYISFGGSRRLADMDSKMRRDIVHVIYSTSYYVLWQSDVDHFDLPTDKHLEVAWVPQQSVLNHSNIRLFITNGGLVSLYEAIYFKVPIVGIPFTGEQCYYLNHAVNSGWALRLDYSNISLFSLRWAIKTATEDLSMKDKVFDANILLRDQMYRPIDRAIHHVNYVLRHGSRQLRSPALKFGFFEYHSLDTTMIWFVVVFVLVKILALVCCIYGGELCRSLRDLGRKYNETFFGTGISQSRPQTQHRKKESNRQTVPEEERPVSRRKTASKKEDLNYPNIIEEDMALPLEEADSNIEPQDKLTLAPENGIFEGIGIIAGISCDKIVTEAVAIVENVDVTVADERESMFEMEQTQSIDASFDVEQSTDVVPEEVVNVPNETEASHKLKQPQALNECGKSTYKVGKNNARNKKLRNNRKLMESRRLKK